MVIEYIRKLRNFIENEINYKPKPGMENAKYICLEKISFTETTLVNENLWNLLHMVYQCRDLSKRTAAAYKIGNWARMAIKR